jgi:hypothetical protein
MSDAHGPQWAIGITSLMVALAAIALLILLLYQWWWVITP